MPWPIPEPPPVTAAMCPCSNPAIPSPRCFFFVLYAAFAAGAEAGLLPLTVAVLDVGGNLVLLKRQDGSGNLRADIAIGKAAGALGMDGTALLYPSILLLGIAGWIFMPVVFTIPLELPGMTASITIVKKQLTVTAADKSKTYDGAVYSPFTYAMTGFANGETEASLRTAGTLFALVGVTLGFLYPIFRYLGRSAESPRFAADTMPRSHTSTTSRIAKRCLSARTTGTSVLRSEVLPGQISQATGSPSRRITTPTTSCK